MKKCGWYFGNVRAAEKRPRCQIHNLYSQSSNQEVKPGLIPGPHKVDVKEKTESALNQNGEKESVCVFPQSRVTCL